jgi:hypothetical protein
MTLQRISAICFCILITPAIATGQPTSTATSQAKQGPAGGVIQPAHEAGAVMPLRRTQTRSTSSGREVLVETVESLDIEGRLAPIDEIVTETRRERNTQHVRQDVFRFTPERRRQLSETTESRQDTQPNGDTGTVHNTWALDLNGHLRLMSRRTEQTTSSAPDVRQTTTTLLVPHINEALRETERSEHTARRVTPGVVQHQSTHLVRDINGRWTPVELRNSQVREIAGTSEQLEEETVQYPDLNGNLAVAETNVIRRSRTNDQELVVIETYAQSSDGWPRADGGARLSQRIQRTTTATADGGRSTVEEVEARSPVAPNDPMRVIRRTVTTVRPISAERWVTERQVFEPDLEGRLRLVRNE